MTATTTEEQPVVEIDPRPIPLSRLTRVELRKLADTRAGLWLLIAIAGITAATMAIQLAVGVTQDLSLTYNSFLMAMSTPIGVLLPVLGIMSVTSEWGQRTGLVTFTLEPRRGRVVAAKLLGAVVVGIVSIAVALALAAVGNVLFGSLAGDGTTWDVSVVDALLYVLVQTIALVTGFAFGMLLMNTAAAIVLFFVYTFVLPGLFLWGASVLDWFSDLRPWIDFANAQSPLLDGSIDGQGWAHFAVAGLIWLVLPLTAGIARLLRSEVK